MSMCLYIKSAPATDLSRLLRDPDALMSTIVPAGTDLSSLADVVSPDALERRIAETRREMQHRGWRGRILGFFMARQLRSENARLAQSLEQMKTRSADAATDGVPVLDLHKSWHVLHYLFTGTAWEGDAPANTLLCGGRELGEDLGYGPARLVTPAETAAFDRFLSSLSMADLQRGIDPVAMAAHEVYGVDEESIDAELIDEIEHYFPLLKSYVAAATQRGHGVGIWMA